MPSISETLLAGGNAVHLEAYHGEKIAILTGVDAGKVFIAVKETEPDIILETVIGEDPRTKLIARFRTPNVPNLTSQDIVSTDDGKRWYAVRRPGDVFLTVDFELKEIVE